MATGCKEKADPAEQADAEQRENGMVAARYAGQLFG